MAAATTAIASHSAAHSAHSAVPVAARGALQWRRPHDLFAATLRDTVLTLATLGLYSFFAKTNARRRLWSGISIDGRRLAYTGTARELWMPALVIAAAVCLIVALGLGIKWLWGPFPKPNLATLRSPWRFSLTLPLILMLALGAWRVRDFLLRRTTNGIAAGSLPEATRIPYVLQHFAATLALGLTVGLAFPWRAVRLHQKLSEGATFAGMAVTTHGSARTLYRWFWIPWAGGVAVYLAAVIMLGVWHGPKILAAQSRIQLPDFSALEWLSVAAIVLSGLVAFLAIAAVYQAQQWRHLAAMTRLDGRALALNIPTAGFVRMTVTTALLRIATLGLFGALAGAIKTDYLLRHLQLAPAQAP